MGVRLCYSLTATEREQDPGSDQLGAGSELIVASRRPYSHLPPPVTRLILQAIQTKMIQAAPPAISLDALGPLLLAFPLAVSLQVGSVPGWAGPAVTRSLRGFWFTVGGRACFPVSRCFR
jgi:hypothetical protein